MTIMGKRLAGALLLALVIGSLFNSADLLWRLVALSVLLYGLARTSRG